MRTRVRVSNRVLAVVLGFAMLTFYGCSGGGSNGGGGGGGTATVTGQVTGSGGLEGVAVSAGGISDTTDANGFYLLEAVPVPADGRLVLTYEKAGYATYQRSVLVEADGNYAVPAALKLYDINEMAVDQTAPPVLDGKNANQEILVRLELPPNSLSGAAAGDVRVSVAVGDPSTPEGRAVFPGDYMAASSAGASPDTPLESVAFTEITIVDAAGSEVTGLTTPATVTLRLPDEFQSGGAKAGAYVPGDPVKGFIPWWSYDETNGTWIREDANPSTPDVLDNAEVVDPDLDENGTPDGVLYGIAQVTHFTWWNIDQPLSTHACICVRVVDGAGMPRGGTSVRAEGVTYSGISRPDTANMNGRACVNVKRSATEQSRERVLIRAETGGIGFPYNVTNMAEGDTETDQVSTPLEQGSTLDGIQAGECLMLANDLVVSLEGTIQGTVTFTGSSQPVVGIEIFSNFGERAVTNDQGFYSMAAPVGVDVVLSGIGLQSQSARVESADTPATANFEFPNQNPQIQSLTQTPNTTPLDPGKAVTFDVTAQDPDGDPLTYAWTASAGSPLSGTGRQFSWTAPATPQTAQITAIVQDDKGGEASQTRQVIVGGGTGGTVLTIHVKDNPDTSNDVAGIYVILYQEDNVTVRQTIQTGTDGVADFGDVGRDRVTVTIAGEEIDASNAFRWLDTFVDVPVGEIIYHVDDRDLSCPTPPAINVSVVDPTSAVQTARLGPFVGLSDFQAPIGFSAVSVCPSIRQQSDNGLMLLVQGFSDFFGTFSSFGFLEIPAAQVTDGTTYTVTLDRAPTMVSWSTVPETHETSVYFEGERQGVFYELGSSLDAGDGLTDGAGSLPLATGFPVDNHWVSAMAQTPVLLTTLYTDKRYAPIAATASVPIPDYEISNFRFDDATGTFAWLVSGSTPRDVMALYASAFLFGDGTGGITMSSVEWLVVMDGGATQWQVPNLPAPLDTWLDFANLQGEGAEAFISAIDLDSVTGLDAAWDLLVQGIDPEDAATQIFEGTQSIFLQGGAIRTAARQGAPAFKPHSQRLEAFNGLRRK